MSLLFKEISTSLVFRFAILVLAFLVGILLARMGPEIRGYFVLLTTTSSLLAILINFGSCDAVIYQVGNNTSKTNEIYWNSLISNLIISLIVTIIYYIILITINSLSYLSRELYELYFVGGFSILPLAVGSLLRHFILGQQKILHYNIILLCDQLFLLLAMVFSLYFTTPYFNTASYCYLFSSFVSLTVALFFTRTILKEGFSKVDIYQIKEIYVSGYKFFMSGLNSFVTDRVYIYYLQSFTSISQLGVFSVGSTLSNLFLITPNQLSTILFTKVCNAETSTQKESYFLIFSRIYILLSLILITVLLLFNNLLIDNIFGSKYVESFSTSKILILTAFVTGMYSIIISYFNGLGKFKISVISSTLNLIFSVVIGYFLISKYNIIGAACSKLIVSFIILFFVYYMFNTIRSIYFDYNRMIFDKRDFRKLLILMKNQF